MVSPKSHFFSMDFQNLMHFQWLPQKPLVFNGFSEFNAFSMVAPKKPLVFNGFSEFDPFSMVAPKIPLFSMDIQNLMHFQWLPQKPLVFNGFSEFDAFQWLPQNPIVFNGFSEFDAFSMVAPKTPCFQWIFRI